MRTRAGVLLLTVVLALAGCGGTASPSPSGDPSASGTSPAPAPVESSTEPSIPGLPATSADLITYIQAGNELSPETYADEYGVQASFSTPSGNISCGSAFADSWVLCWVGENTWPSIPTPTCEVGDWGDNWVTVSNEGVKRGACLSEQPFPMPGEVLPYGSSVSIGDSACRSESTFLACVNVGTGNGFVISKAIYHTYGPIIT